MADPIQPPAGPGGRRVRIGCGAGFSNDRIDPARDLAERGALDFLFFECLAERTLANAHALRAADPRAGYDPWLKKRMEAVLRPCREAGTRVISNMGSANPAAAGEAVAEVARSLGLQGLKVAVVEGDDVAAHMTPDLELMDGEGRLGEVPLRMTGANAYLGHEPIREALEAGAEVVITGRCADPSLAVGPLAHAFGWAADDWARLGAGTLVGHLLECSTQVTGGYYADPGRKEVPGLAFLGFPFAEVAEDGSAVIGKLDGTGGLVSRGTVLEQMLYEVHDPAAYLTPDVTADFSRVRLAEPARDRVAVSGGVGRARPETLKVTIGFDGGFLSEGEISYAGPNALARARLAGEVIETRMREVHGHQGPIRQDFIGLSSLHGTAHDLDAPPYEPAEVRLRMALRTHDRDLAEALPREVEGAWLSGPAGGGGARGRVTPAVTTRSALLPRGLARPTVRMITA